MNIINIIFSTKEIQNAYNLMDSVSKQIELHPPKDYEIRVTILDKTSAQSINPKLTFAYQRFDINVVDQSYIDVLERLYLGDFHLAQCSLAIDSIQRTRIQQQAYIKAHFESFQDTIIWQVDDDMLFCEFSVRNNAVSFDYTYNYFQTLSDAYEKDKYVADALIGENSFVPPIPSLLYTNNQLTDLLYNTYDYAPEKQSLDYHDFHFDALSAGKFHLNLYKDEVRHLQLKKALYGFPVTRPLIHRKTTNSYMPSRLLRGGNFIVFNPQIFLDAPHLGFPYAKEQPARRSDMIHCRLLKEAGYRIFDTTQWCLVHNRNFQAYAFKKNTDDYFSDFIGGLLITYLDQVNNQVSNVEKRFQFHQNHIASILSLLKEHGLDPHFEKEVFELSLLQERIKKISLKELVFSFQSFKEYFDQINLKPCKLEL